jgi:DNA-binding transcriptional ArsR family regulator
MTFERKEVFWIDNVQTFELLADPTKVEILELTAIPHSVSEIAQAMGVPRTRLYHHVGALEEAGIIAVAATRQAGAMTEKLYQAAAKSYQPSDTFRHGAPSRDVADAIMAALLGSTRADFVRAADEGLVNMHDDKSMRSVSLGRRLLRLTPERLAQLIGDLEELFDRYDAPDDDGVPIGVLHVIHPSSRRIG